MRNRALIILPFLLIFLFYSDIQACMCGNTSVCDAYSQTSTVVIAEVKEIKNPEINKSGFYDSNQIVILTVEKAFKGAFQKEIKLSQPSSNCDWWFENKNLHKKYLFYLSKSKDKNVYKVVSCGRSKDISDAADDLSWLAQLPKSLKRTRISGSTELNANNFLKLPGINLQISGNGKNYAVKTDNNGFYEIWDVPVGNYSITPQIPNDLALNWTSSMPDNWTYFWSQNEQDKKALNITIEPQRCGGVDFMFKRKNDEN